MKYSFESPPGLKYNVQNTWNTLGNTLRNNLTPLKSKLFFNLSLFHAIIQERRNYIPQGWVKFYEFSYSDLLAGIEIINNHINKDDSVNDWNIIKGLFSNAI